MKMTMTMNTTNTPLCDDDSPFDCNSSFVFRIFIGICLFIFKEGFKLKNEF